MKKTRFIGKGEFKVEELAYRCEWLCRPDLVDAQQLLLVRVRMEPGQCHDFHRHPAREEILYILQGQAEQWVETERRVLSPGEMAHIPTNLVHGTFNSFEKPLLFLAILSPAKSNLPDTIEMHQEQPWHSLRSNSS